MNTLNLLLITASVGLFTMFFLFRGKEYNLTFLGKTKSLLYAIFNWDYIHIWVFDRKDDFDSFTERFNLVKPVSSENEPKMTGTNTPTTFVEWREH
jgi:hypothetical protein